MSLKFLVFVRVSKIVFLFFFMYSANSFAQSSDQVQEANPVQEQAKHTTLKSTPANTIATLGKQKRKKMSQRHLPQKKTYAKSTTVGSSRDDATSNDDSPNNNIVPKKHVKEVFVKVETVSGRKKGVIKHNNKPKR